MSTKRVGEVITMLSVVTLFLSLALPAYAYEQLSEQQMAVVKGGWIELVSGKTCTSPQTYNCEDLTCKTGSNGSGYNYRKINHKICEVKQGTCQQSKRYLSKCGFGWGGVKCAVKWVYDSVEACQEDPDSGTETAAYCNETGCI